MVNFYFRRNTKFKKIEFQKLMQLAPTLTSFTLNINVTLNTNVKIDINTQNIQILMTEIYNCLNKISPALQGITIIKRVIINN